MRKLILTLIILIIIVGCAPLKQKEVNYGGAEESGAIQGAEEVPTSVIVKMKDGKFDKPVVKISRGGTVTWKNDDIRPYLFIIYYKDVDEKGNVKIEKTSTGRINDGEEFSHTFEKTGEYKLVPIEYGKLRGLVQVE